MNPSIGDWLKIRLTDRILNLNLIQRVLNHWRHLVSLSRWLIPKIWSERYLRSHQCCFHRRINTIFLNRIWIVKFHLARWWVKRSVWRLWDVSLLRNLLNLILKRIDRYLSSRLKRLHSHCWLKTRVVILSWNTSLLAIVSIFEHWTRVINLSAQEVHLFV